MKNVMIILGAVFLSACASKIPVTAQVDGSLLVESAAADKDYARKSAIKMAQKYCDKKGQIPVVISQDTAYEGSIGENESKMIRVLGNVGGVLAGSKATDVSDAATEDSRYVSKLKFKCQ